MPIVAGFGTTGPWASFGSHHAQWIVTGIVIVGRGAKSVNAVAACACCDDATNARAGRRDDMLAR